MIRLTSITRRLAGSCALATLVGLAGLALPAAAQSSCGYTVTSNLDSGSGTLRNGIASGASAICFDLPNPTTITLLSPLSITSGLSLNTTVANGITISGGGAVQVFNINDPNGYDQIVIIGLTIQSGIATNGGGIEIVAGNVTLSGVLLSANVATSLGGGLYNQGTVTLLNTNVQGNSATEGGGLFNAYGATMILTNAQVTNNSSAAANLGGLGGGLANSGTVTATGGLFRSNISDQGGAIFAMDYSSLAISGGTQFLANNARGSGGAIQSNSALISITGATFSGNGANAAGGAIFNTGTLSASESTFAANSAVNFGGAIYNNTTLDESTSLTLNNVTISTNAATGGPGGGIENVVNEAPSLTINNSIVAGNTAQSGSADCDGCGQLVGEANTIGGTAGLGPLADNGGPTQTMMPLPGGAEIGTGNAYVNQDQTDQRGFSRLSNGAIDRGAVQDHYSSVSFYTQPPATVQGQGQVITPPVQVQVVEKDGSTLNYPQGVPVTMLLQTVNSVGTPVLTGGAATYPTTATNPPTASFSGLSVNTSGSFYLLATTLPSASTDTAAPYASLSSNFIVSAPVTPTTTALSISPQAPTYGKPMTLTATVTESSTGVPVPSGTVTFTDNTENVVGLGSAPVVNGVASVPVSLAAGNHALKATYGGTSTESESFGTLAPTVGKAAPTLALNAPTDLLPGVRLSTSNVQAFATDATGAAVPGTFSFSPTLCTPNSDCAAPAPGSVTVTATFTPNDSTDYSSGSAEATVKVLPPAATSTTLTASPNSALANTAVALTATVSGASNTPGVVGGPRGTVTLSPADGTFTPLTLTPATAAFQGGAALSYTGYATYATYSADFNGDGAADLLIVPDLGAPQLLLSDISSHTGAYLPASSLSPGADCPEIIGSTVGDINRDGLPDIALVCKSSTQTKLVVLINQGGGSFAISPTLFTYFSGIESAQLVIGDFNNDGLADIVALTQCYASSECVVLAFLPQGPGSSFATNYEPIQYGGSSDSFANLLAADFNGDGNLDVAFIHYSNAHPYGIVEVWKNSGGSTLTFGIASGVAPNLVYSATKTIAAGQQNPDITPTLYSLISGTFKTGDLPDLALVTTVVDPNGSDAYGSLSIALNSSKGRTLSFPDSTTDTSTGGGQTSIVSADFDGDGIADLALYNSGDNTVRVLHGAGDGTFSSTTEPNFYFSVDDPVGSPGARAPLNSHGATARIGTRGIATPGTTAQPNGSSQINELFYPVIAAGDTNGDGFPDILVTQLTSPLDDTSDASISAQQFITTGPSTATAGVTATGSSVSYTATTSPAAPYWASSSGSTTLTSDTLDTTTTLTVTDSSTSTSTSSTSPASSTSSTSPTPTYATYGGSVTLKATVVNKTGNAAVSNGTVTFTDTVGTITTTTSGVPVTNGLAVLLVTPTPIAGSHSYAASYSGFAATGEGSSSTANPSTLVIAKYSPKLTWATPAQITTTTALSGTQLDASATGAGATSALPGSFVYSPSAGTTLSAGTHTLSVTFMPTDATDYATVTDTVSITVVKTSPTLHWATPSAITTSTSLSSTQLDATATGLNGASLTGSFVYSPASGTLPFGTQTLSVTFTPTDSADYTPATTTVTIQVGDSTPVTTLSASSSSPVYGQPLTLTAGVSNGHGTAAISSGTVTFTSGGTALGSPVAVIYGVATLSGVSLSAGTHALGATYSGTTTGENPGNPATLSLTVAKATPTLTWATPAAISSTTALSAEQLDAAAAGTNGASLPGAFVYTPASGTLSVGSHTLSVTFTPTDSTDYTTASATVTLTVFSTNTQTALTVSPAQITYGQAAALSAQVTNSSGSTVIQAGTVAFAADNVTLSTVNVVNGAASLSGVSLTGGTHVLTATYSGATGEGASAATRSVTVAKAMPVLSWSTPAQISSTTPLGATQLNASAAGINGAALTGAFSYSPAAGTLLTVGPHTLTVTFTPTDATDYATATTQVSIQVAAETIALTSISPATTPLSTTPLAVTLTGSGFPSTAVVQLNGTTLPTTLISTTQLGATIPASTLSKAGPLSLTIYDAASQAISNAVTLTVTAPTPTVMLTVPATVVSGGQPNVTLALAKTYPVDIAGTFTLTFAPAGPDGVDDPSVQFSTGGRVFSFTIPAGVTTGPTASLQSGTVEGTISVATALTAGGVNVTPTDLSTPTAIAIAAEPPTITGVTFTDVNGLITAVVTGFSNTREMASAQFILTGPGASDLSSPSVTIPAVDLFTAWYTNADSATFGSSFSYTQTFQLSDPTTDITGVAVTLTNTAGTSTSVNSQ